MADGGRIANPYAGRPANAPLFTAYPQGLIFEQASDVDKKLVGGFEDLEDQPEGWQPKNRSISPMNEYITRIKSQGFNG
ncbi:hypothetical protein Sme01_42750 [Sphaerisporangium melleum]|uniref:Uncharacterized protein n=1 Tax=Sphaerisporangium melleum TaxID=321316 RepID=A0A917QXV2_9ACTN|nr:hypothetical protein [Sphaerisporangium melleum]GGK77031.1 hypothetical protein GCM10007964_19710 [Sphaerisporangium melleum]GII71799.1 hypothetical protein Sme01_42750 [Sphaerisporangium melleum]